MTIEQHLVNKIYISEIFRGYDFIEKIIAFPCIEKNIIFEFRLYPESPPQKTKCHYVNKNIAEGHDWDVFFIIPRLAELEASGDTFFSEAEAKRREEFLHLAFDLHTDRIIHVTQHNVTSEKDDLIAELVTADMPCRVVYEKLQPQAEPAAVPAPVPDIQHDPKKADAFVKKISIAYENDTTVIIRTGVQERQVSSDEIGFKESSKPWKMFVDLLQSRDHTIFIGTYSKDPVERKAYEQQRKLKSELNEKLSIFFNKDFNAGIPQKYKFFDNLHRTRADRPGTYKPKFKIAKPSSERQLSKEEALNKLAVLSKKYKRDQDEASFNEAVELGNSCLSEKWITVQQYQEMIHIDDQII